MLKNLFFLLIFIFMVSIVAGGFSQEKKQPQGVAGTKQPQATSATTPAPVAQEEKKTENFTLIKGTIKEVATDKTYIIVDDTKILTTKEFLAESYLEAGDKVEITAEKASEGLKAVSYNYVFDEEPMDESGAGPLEDAGATGGDEALPKE